MRERKLIDLDNDYSTMTEIGEVKIGYQDGKFYIEMEGFEFDDLPTCRMASQKVVAWLIDMLQAHEDMSRLLPEAAAIICID